MIGLADRRSHRLSGRLRGGAVGVGGAEGWRDPRLPTIVDQDRTSQMQAEADAADLGNLDTDTKGAFRPGSRRHRTGQSGVATEAFDAYGRICAACGDTHRWRIEFAHLIRYGRAADERWFVGIPLCGNHHADLDDGRLILNHDYTWTTPPEGDVTRLGVTAKTCDEFIKSGLRPSKRVIDARLASLAQA